ncbi:MAG: hypothetical protein C0502_03135 [Opitutus sp.]|nr:hypothetical protein [Opitutus sp.]
MASNADSSSRSAVGAQSCRAQTPTPVSASGRSLWLWVAASFLFLALLWTAMFLAARQADTRTVPLQTKGAGK